MGKVIFLMNVSLDGYIETRDHSLDWTITDDELHTWFNERLRSTEVSVYGRRLFEVMSAYWPTAESDPTATGPMLDFGRIWNAKPKVVVSSSMQEAPPGWRLTSGDPETILEELRRDPVILGGGTPFFPDLERPAGLRLLDTRTFSSGAVYLGFAAR